MTTEYIALKRDMTVEEAFVKIRSVGLDKETIYTCYVTDSRRRLIGVVTAKDLLLSELTQTLGDIMEENVIFSYTTDDQESVIQVFSISPFSVLLPIFILNYPPCKTASLDETNTFSVPCLTSN